MKRNILSVETILSACPPPPRAHTHTRTHAQGEKDREITKTFVGENKEDYNKDKKTRTLLITNEHQQLPTVLHAFRSKLD